MVNLLPSGAGKVYTSCAHRDAQLAHMETQKCGLGTGDESQFKVRAGRAQFISGTNAMFYLKRQVCDYLFNWIFV